MPSKIKILVVDDELLILNAVCRALSKIGYRVFSAGNMEELRKVLAEAPFDLLITDVHLVEESVEYVIRQVCDSSPSVRILRMSGSHNNDCFPNFIEKPFSIDGLRQKVRDILNEPR